MIFAMSLLSQPDLKITPLAIYAKLTIIAVVRENATWGAYQSDRFTEVNEVAALGEPLKEQDAAGKFPEIAQHRLLYKV